MRDTAGPRTGYSGWWILAACFLCSVVVVGSTIYSFGVYVTAAGESFGLGRAQANVGMMVAQGLLSPFVGHAMDRHSIRWMVSAGAIIAAERKVWRNNGTGFVKFQHSLLGAILGGSTSTVGHSKRRLGRLPNLCVPSEL